MKTFVLKCQAYHLAKSALHAHGESAEARELGSETAKQRFQLFLDLTHWPDSPELRGLTLVEVEELVQWGGSFQVRLDTYHETAKYLRFDMDKCWSEAMKALGVDSAHVFTSASGAVSERLRAAFAYASSTRATLLDGIGYVSDHDPKDSHFLPSFLRASKLKLKDLRLITETI